MQLLSNYKQTAQGQIFHNLAKITTNMNVVSNIEVTINKQISGNYKIKIRHTVRKTEEAPWIIMSIR